MDAKAIVGKSNCFINIIAKEYAKQQTQKSNLTKMQMFEAGLNEFFKDFIYYGEYVDVTVIENQGNNKNYPIDLYPISLIEIKDATWAWPRFYFDDFNQFSPYKKYNQIGNFKNLSDKNDQIIEAFRKYMADHLDEIKPGLGAEYRKMLFNNLIAETKITADQIGRTTYGMETKFNRVKNILDNKTKIQENIVDASQFIVKK